MESFHEIQRDSMRVYVFTDYWLLTIDYLLIHYYPLTPACQGQTAAGMGGYKFGLKTHSVLKLLIGGQKWLV